MNHKPPLKIATKQILTLLFFMIISIHSIGQLQTLTVPNKYVKFGTSGTVLNSLPQQATIPISNGYTGQTTKFASNSFYDSSGDLLFFIIDSKVYDGDGYFIGEMLIDYSIPFEPNTEWAVIPAPGNCCKFYIVGAYTLTSGSGSLNVYPASLYYTTLDMCTRNENFPDDANYPENVNRYGYLEEDPLVEENVSHLIFDYLNNSSSDDGVTNNYLSVSDEDINGNRKLFLTNASDIFRFTVSSTGITYDNYTFTFAGTTSLLAGYVGDRSESELIKKANGNYILAVPNVGLDLINNINPNQFTATIGLYELDASFNLINTSFCHQGSNFSFVNKGIEFSSDGNYIYYTSYQAPYVGCYDISNFATPTHVSLSQIGTPINYRLGFIEMGYDGKLYYAHAGGLSTLNVPNTPLTSTFTASAFNFTNTLQIQHYVSAAPQERYYALPDQIDIDNLDILVTDQTSECCERFTGYDLQWYSTIGDITVANAETWSPGVGNNPWDDVDGIVHVQNELRISGGYNITMNGMVFKFAPSAKMIIDRYARVTSLNSTFTSLDCDGLMWLGIEVWGYSNLGQSMASNTPQGKFVLQSSNVENAINGITACRLNNGVYQLSHSGGIVRATTTDFINNRRDIDFQTYVPTNSPNNLSFFKSCNFTTDGRLKDLSYLSHHVNLTRIKGIYFTQCTFANIDISAYPVAFTRGTGIRSYDSYFIVQEGCSVPQLFPNPCPVGNQLPSTFENLVMGINAFSLNPANTVMIKNNQFTNCNRGILLRSIDNATIYNNNFDVGSDFVVFGVNRSYGVYLDNCTAYNFSENDFISNYNGYYGVYVNNSLEDANKIYHNTVTGLKEGMIAAAKNDGGNTYDGLDFQCNIFSNDATVDIGVVLGNYQPNIQDIGISDYQGLCQLDANGLPVYNSPANNILTNPSPSIPNVNGVSGDIWQNTGVDFTTYSFTGSPTLKTEPVNINLIGNTQLSNCALSPFSYNPISNYNLACPTVNLFRPRPILFSEVNQLKNLVNTNSLLIDGGNTQVLIDYINSTNQAWQIRDYLMNHSPFLSDAVLLALINKTPSVASWVIDEVLSACTPVGDEVLLALVNRTPQVPAYILRDLFVEAKPVRKDVMIALINKSGIPDWVIKEVAVANSPLSDDELLALLQRQQALTASTVNEIFMLNTPLTPQVQSAFNTRIPKLPNWVKNNIANSSFVAAHPNTRQKISSPVQDLLSENAIFTKSIQLNYQEIIRQYINDTTVINPEDSILYIYKIGGMSRSKCKQVKTLLYKGDYASAEALNDSIRAFNVPELNLTCTMTDMILQIYRDTAGCYKLMEDLALKQEFETKAGEAFTCKECCQAQAILEIVFGTKFAETFDDLVPEIATRSSSSFVENIEDEINIEYELNVKLYPNPNSGTFTIGYFPENDIAINTIRLFDMTGKLIYDQQVNILAGSTRDFNLDLPAGIYFTEIIDEVGVKQIIKISVTE